MSAEHVKVITTNRRARFEYHVESKLECGIALTGTEVKSLRDGSAQLSDSYAIPKSGELALQSADLIAQNFPDVVAHLNKCFHGHFRKI